MTDDGERLLFVDTSALYAILDGDDEKHSEALSRFRAAADDRCSLITHSYVVSESFALVQRRLSQRDVLRLQSLVAGAVEMHIVDRKLHDLGVQAVLREDRRKLSLVDCVSFAFMERKGVANALAFDAHFDEAGFHWPD